MSLNKSLFPFLYSISLWHFTNFLYLHIKQERQSGWHPIHGDGHINPQGRHLNHKSLRQTPRSPRQTQSYWRDTACCHRSHLLSAFLCAFVKSSCIEHGVSCDNAPYLGGVFAGSYIRQGVVGDVMGLDTLVVPEVVWLSSLSWTFRSFTPDSKTDNIHV